MEEQLMSLPTMSGTGRLVADPDLRFGASGIAVVKVNLAFNSRKKQDDGTYVDDKVFFVEGVAFKQLAEHVAECLTRGMEVNVSGRLVTEQWNDKNTGDKRSKTSLLLDAIGPNLAFATAQVKKMERSGGQSGGGQQPSRGSAAAEPDPWASDSPPF
jgi:single-strand DNA-binding protein